MDPVTGVGLAASIIGIIQVTGAVLTLAHGYIGGVRSASKDIEELKGALDNFSQVLRDLEDHVKKNPQLKTLTKLNCKNGPLEQCGRELENLHSKLAKPEKNRVAKLIHLKSLKWPLKKEEVSEFLLQLERYKSLFILALGFDQTLLLRALGGYLQSTDAAVLGIAKNIEDTARDTKVAIGSLDSKVDVESVAQDQWRQKDAARKQEEDDLRAVEKRRKVLKWLYPAAYEAKHLETTNRRQEGTGSWFLSSPEFQEFIDPQKPNPSQLWAHGNAGVGKTFISSHVIDYLKGLGGCGVAYMYLDDRQDTISVVRSLVVQLCYQLPRLPKEIEYFYDNGEILKLGEMYGVLLTTLNSFPRVFLVFDALDEFRHKEREQLLPLVEKMNKDGFRIFLTSRPHPKDIMRSLSQAAKIAISANGEDISSFIEGKFHVDPDSKDLVDKAGYSISEIVSELTDCAQGMFLLVRLCVDHLCEQTTPNEILAALREFRNYSNSKRDGMELLNKIYGKIMARIDGEGESRRNLALRVLSWVLKARETLTIDELQVAVSMQREKYELDKLGRDLTNREMLLDVCSSLVVIDEDTKDVRFAHYTVQEFLQKDTILLGVADSNVIMACTTYLSLDIFAEGASRSQLDYDSRMELNPFHKYAARYLPVHLQDCDETQSVDFVLRFLGREGSIDSFLQALSSVGHGVGQGYFDGYPRERTPLHMASSLGHYAATRLLLENGADVFVTDSAGLTPLHLAAEEGHDRVVQLLVENGFNAPTACCWQPKLGRALVCVVLFLGFSVVIFGVSSVVGSSVVVAVVSTLGLSTGFGPKATRQGRRFAIRMLIKRAADISAMSNNVLHRITRRGLQGAAGLLIGEKAYITFGGASEMTALYYAARNGHDAVVSLLIDEGANVPETEYIACATLAVAAEAGHKGVVRLLIERGTYAFIQCIKQGEALRSAVEEGHVEVARLLIEKGASVSAVDNLGRSTLHCAVRKRGHGAIQLLIENGAVLSAADINGKTALHNAASLYEGYMVVRLLIENGADTSAIDGGGRMALHYAAAVRGGHRVVRLLLDKGANTVQVRDINGKTALHYAAGAMEGQNTIQLLLERGADILAVDKDGKTVLHYAARVTEGHESIRLLIEKGADILALDSNGETALHVAAEMYGGHMGVQSLVESGADISVVGKGGETALHRAARLREGHIAVQLLIGAGADISVIDIEGRTALHRAAGLQESQESVRLLIKGGADISVFDNNGKTALHHAAGVWRADESVRLLLENGADTSALDCDGKTALHHAAATNNGFKAVQMLVEKGVDISVVDRNGKTALLYAAEVEGGDKAFRLLVEGGADISVLDNGKTVLHYAAGVRGGHEVVRLLIEMGADISARDSDGKTPLHYAVEAYGGCEAVRLLLDGGVDISALDNNRKTALHYAAGVYGGDKAVLLLLEMGADTSVLDDNGKTPLHYAAGVRDGHGVARLLAKMGADISARDSDGKTPLHYAAEAYGGRETVRLLLDGGVDISALDNNRRTVLHYSAGAYEGHKTTRLLLEKGADILARDINGRTAMDEAVAERRVETVKVLKAWP